MRGYAHDTDTEATQNGDPDELVYRYDCRRPDDRGLHPDTTGDRDVSGLHRYKPGPGRGAGTVS